MDSALVPPKIADLLTGTMIHKNVSLSTMTALVENTEWSSLPDLFQGTGADGRMTLLAPIDEFWESFINIEDTQRLLSPTWSLHARDLLGHMILPEEYSREALQSSAGIPSLAGPVVAFGQIKDASVQATNG